MTLQFMAHASHRSRLLQMHQYFESVLGLEIEYHARIALLVAFSTAGDMITVQQLFNDWRRSDKIVGGKEMYSAVIRGLIGNNSLDLTPRDGGYESLHGWKGDASGMSTSATLSTATRNGRLTQVYAALELFYDLLRRGGTPTFETYHSLVVGLAAFKNDMEAAELLLDHMLVTKKKPYVQVLHVMCREYTRQRNFAAAERIFDMLREYRIKPKALTCNVMLKAIFQTSTQDALEYMADHHDAFLTRGLQGAGALSDEHLVLQWRRRKVQTLRDYMQETMTLPDNVTFSTLFYGYGFMKDGYPDLRATLAEMTLISSRVEPNLVVLNSLLFAHLNHGKLEIAESILDQILSMSSDYDPKLQLQSVNATAEQQRSPFHPFKRRDQKLTAPVKGPSAYRDPLPLFPPKGAFHALMLACVEHQDIEGMERILDKMIQAESRQHHFLQDAARNSKEVAFKPINLDADEHTANIMLLGYVSQGSLEKAEMVQAQIQSRPDWKSRALFWKRESSRQELLAFVRQQGSQELIQQAIQESVGGEESPSAYQNNKTLLGQGGGDMELDDDIEIDVTTLSAKLKSLQKSIPLGKSSSKA